MSQPLASIPPPSSSGVSQRPASRVAAFGDTHVGRVRQANEDSFLVAPDLGLFAVADGMGGAAAGAEASTLAIAHVREMFEQGDATWPWAAGQDVCRTPGPRLLMAGVHLANARIFTASQRDAEKRGMGTTFAGILTLQDRVVVAHVGDSRVYRLRGRQLDLLTEDHSLLNACIRAGTWSPDDADHFPSPHAITRAVGIDAEVEVDIRLDASAPQDVYLICSDGLHGMLDRRELASILRRHAEPQEAVERLIERANELGGGDNVTAVVARIVTST